MKIEVADKKRKLKTLLRKLIFLIYKFNRIPLCVPILNTLIATPYMSLFSKS